jgi:cobalt-zinc-cadmium efflux system protein
MLTEGVPTYLDAIEARLAMAVVPGVKWIHDLHIWIIIFGLDALSAHVAVPVKGGYMS